MARSWTPLRPCSLHFSQLNDNPIGRLCLAPSPNTILSINSGSNCGILYFGSPEKKNVIYSIYKVIRFQTLYANTRSKLVCLSKPNSKRTLHIMLICIKQFVIKLRQSICNFSTCWQFSWNQSFSTIHTRARARAYIYKFKKSYRRWLNVFKWWLND